MTSESPCTLTDAFEARKIDNTMFRHEQHVRVAYHILQRYDFTDAAARYAQGIRELATAAGAPDKFNVTITFAFMSSIAERIATSAAPDYETFLRDNPDLLSKECLSSFYSKARLTSDAARVMFLLPDIGKAA